MPVSSKPFWLNKRKLAVAFVLAVLIVLVVTYRTHNRHPLQEGEVSLDSPPPPSAETLRYGASLAQVHCARCHGSDLRGMKRDSAGEEVSLGANLTGEGRCSTYTAEDFCKAVREGLRPDGLPISGIMPAIESHDLSDDDLCAIWTFSQNAPVHKGK
jgi:mono/diheme cytochrome c family protein